MPISSGSAPTTVLIVDDDEPSRDALATILRQDGFRVLEAASAAEAWSRMPGRPDLVILDVVMPGGSGLSLCRRIKSDPDTADTPVIMLSGQATGPGEQADGLERGADAYLTKPAEPALVLAHARRLASARRRAGFGLPQMQSVVERMSDGLIVSDPHGHLLDWNPAALKMHGLSDRDEGLRHLSEFVGVFSLSPPDGPPLHIDDWPMTRVLRGEAVHDSELVVRRPEVGLEALIEYRGRPVWTDGRVELGVLTMRDVTEKRRMEAAMVMRDRAIAASTQGILITDASAPDNPVVYASPGFERMTGYTSAEIVGRNCRFLQGPDSDPQAVGRLREAVRAGSTCEVELTNYRKDGTPYWNAVAISPVRDPLGRLTHFVGVQTDATARQALEHQLRQSQKMEAVGQLAGGVAHDFNNLLTVINGYTDLLLASSLAGDPSREMLLEIREAGRRSADLTRQLLAFSRRQVLSPKRLDLNDVVRRSKGLLEHLMGKDAHLSLDLAPLPCPVWADSGQLDQVVMNLCINARDATAPGGRVTISTRISGDEACLAVADTGCGMSPEVRSRVFEPFFTTKPVGRGTGLGLAVVHGVVKQSGGRVEVESRPGAGTTFSVFLPVAAHGVDAASQPSPAARPTGGEETVLLVEDQEAIRTLLRTALRSAGYRVLDAANGSEALRVADEQAGPIHLLITDLVMPKPDGREVAEFLKSREPRMKVLFISGYTEDAALRSAVLAEGVEFLQKPFAPAELALKVRQMLDAPSA